MRTVGLRLCIKLSLDLLFAISFYIIKTSIKKVANVFVETSSNMSRVYHSNYMLEKLKAMFNASIKQMLSLWVVKLNRFWNKNWKSVDLEMESCGAHWWNMEICHREGRITALSSETRNLFISLTPSHHKAFSFTSLCILLRPALPPPLSSYNQLIEGICQTLKCLIDRLPTWFFSHFCSKKSCCR